MSAYFIIAYYRLDKTICICPRVKILGVRMLDRSMFIKKWLSPAQTTLERKLSEKYWEELKKNNKKVR